MANGLIVHAILDCGTCEHRWFSLTLNLRAVSETRLRAVTRTSFCCRDKNFPTSISANVAGFADRSAGGWLRRLHWDGNVFCKQDEQTIVGLKLGLAGLKAQN